MPARETEITAYLHGGDLFNFPSEADPLLCLLAHGLAAHVPTPFHSLVVSYAEQIALAPDFPMPKLIGFADQLGRVHSHALLLQVKEFARADELAELAPASVVADLPKFTRAALDAHLHLNLSESGRKAASTRLVRAKDAFGELHSALFFTQLALYKPDRVEERLAKIVSHALRFWGDAHFLLPHAWNLAIHALNVIAQPVE